ncbi:MAG: zinc ribbon domain-containing protein [Candidatus Aenigmatarchaeota archaeon]
MRCEFCNTKLQKKWNYCPNCGVMIGNYDMMEFLNRQIKNLAKKLEESIDFENDFELPKNITITITPLPMKTQPKKQIINSEPIKLPEKVIEPETKVRRLVNEIIFSIKLPGVKRKEDIDLQIFSNSVEVRALAENKGYFKIINIPNNYVLVNKKFENQELILHFNRF